MRHVEQIAQRPHPMGTADHDRVRDYIVGQLSARSASTPKSSKQPRSELGIGKRGTYRTFLLGFPGRGPSRKAVLIMAHYDGVEAGPAASDDGAASAALLETLRALQARKQPMTHDVVALFTDGEEAGLLGAAAFVREHPWAKDVAIVPQFRGARDKWAFANVRDGAGKSRCRTRAAQCARRDGGIGLRDDLSHALPNDTDLSEVAVLGLPALNFAFADGVERYHTSRDDIAHLNPGSLQHHGSQMLTMARTFGTDALPRPRTGDGVFFDLPIVGLVVYPQGLELPLAILALVLVVTIVVRDRTGLGTGVLATLVAVALSGAVGWIVGGRLHGPAVWSGLYATAIVLFALAVTAMCYAIARRWATPRGIHAGVLIVWLVLALGLAVRVPGVSYLLTWPLLFAAGAALMTRGREIAEWAAAIVTLLILVGFVYGVSVIMLGVTGVGAIALCVVASLITLLLAPQLGVVAGDARWSAAPWLAGAGVVCLLIAALTGAFECRPPTAQRIGVRRER